MVVETDLLKFIPHFPGLSLADLEAIGKSIFEKAAERDELIFLEGEPAEALYFVAAGVVKVFKTSAEGKEQILYFVRPGESINDVPIFGGGPNPASAQAMVPVVLYGMKKDALEAVLRGHSQVALNVNEVLAGQVRHLVSLVEDLSFKRVTSRVAKILLEHLGGGRGSWPRLTQREMAAMAGTAREMVGRSLKTLEEEGAIRLDRHRIVITDREALREMEESAS